MKQKGGRSVEAASSCTRITAVVRGIAKNSPPTPHLWAVHFADTKHGWVVGKEGKILHTNDGGELWYEQQSNTERSLLGVYFVNPQTGWVVGTGGLILHTTDGGANWQPQKSATTKTLRGVAFRDSKQGWAVGEDGLILHTNDAGGTWSPQPSGSAWHLLDICLYKGHALDRWIKGHHFTSRLNFCPIRCRSHLQNLTKPC